MKKITLFVLLVTTISFNKLSAQTTSPAPYCVATFDDPIFPIPDAIFSVSFGTLSNVTNAHCAFPHYIFYNSLAIPNFVKGSTTNNLSVIFDAHGGCGYGVWIDFNQNNIFETTERVMGSTSSTDALPPGVVTKNQTITIPSTATTGNTRMRVRVVEDDQYTSTVGYLINPCNASATPTDVMDYGETEDYTINITAPLGLHDVNQVDNLIVYPNPVTTTLNVKQDLSNNITYKIISIRGQEMQTGIINNSEKQISISSLSEGIYFLQLFDNNKTLGQQRFVKSAK